MVTVAQLAEHWIVVPRVVGSNPISHPKRRSSEMNSCFFCWEIREFREVREVREGGQNKKILSPEVRGTSEAEGVCERVPPRLRSDKVN